VEEDEQDHHEQEKKRKNDKSKEKLSTLVMKMHLPIIELGEKFPSVGKS